MHEFTSLPTVHSNHNTTNFIKPCSSLSNIWWTLLAAVHATAKCDRLHHYKPPVDIRNTDPIDHAISVAAGVDDHVMQLSFSLRYQQSFHSSICYISFKFTWTTVTIGDTEFASVFTLVFFTLVKYFLLKKILYELIMDG
jgi:hypothetical protein